MTRPLRIAVAMAAITAFGMPAAAQKPGGILRVHMIDSPASMSIHEEVTVVAERPVMGVFNNLVIFDQHIAQNSLDTIRPELATKERDEIAIIAAFLPKQMSDDEVKSAIAAIVKETGAASMKDMGRVMAALKERYSGKMDFAKAGGLVKGQLAS